MSTTLRPGDGDVEARVDARSAEAAALRAARVASEAYRATLPDTEQTHVRPDRVAAIQGGAPPDPLPLAVADLSSTALFAARALQIVGSHGPEAAAGPLRRAAVAAATAVDVGVEALQLEPGPRYETLVRELAHAAALVAHLSADTLEACGRGGHGWWPGQTGPAPAPFPESWRRLSELLDRAVQDAERRSGDPARTEPLLRAAAAAANAAERARSAYGRCGGSGASGQAACRLTRTASRAAAHAGWAALEPLTAPAV